MKKSWKHISLGLLALAPIVLAGCDQEKDLYDPDYAKQQFNQTFVKQFGEIPADQSWDFYASMMNGLSTRAAGDAVIDATIGQPSGFDFSEWQQYLKSGVDNQSVGTHNYTLTSPSNGKFKIYAIWYAGWYETYKKFKFEMGMIVNGDKANPIKIFDGNNTDSEPVSDNTGAAFSENPGYGADVYVPAGDKFSFYIKYTNNGSTQTLYSSDGYSTLLFSDLIAVDKKVMVVGFEDNPKDSWGVWNKPDFNDVVLYIEGNPDLPVPEAKRFMCEDLGSIGDFDFNDIVFDIQPTATTGKAIVTLQAAGGTLPATLYVNNQEIGEVHELFGVDTSTMVNTGKGETKEHYSTEINVPDNFDLTTFDNFKVVVKDGNTTREIVSSKTGEAPCVIITPIETSWMKEAINIKDGYPNFFQDNWTKTYNEDKLY